PGEVAPPLAFDAHGKVLDGAAMMVPVAGAQAAHGTFDAMLQLADDDGAAALGEKQQGEGGADFGRAFGGAHADPGIAELVLIFEEDFAAFAVPVVGLWRVERNAPPAGARGDEVALAGHAADALQGVEVVEPPAAGLVIVI